MENQNPNTQNTQTEENPYEGNTELLRELIEGGASPMEIEETMLGEYGEMEALEEALHNMYI